MKQTAVKDVDQLVDTMVSNRKVDDLGRLGGIGINEIELAVCLRNYVMRQSHRHGWYAKGERVFGAGEDDGVFEPKPSPPAVHGLAESAVEI
jgi:hypothetical protein